MGKYREGDGPVPWFKVVKYKWRYGEEDIQAGVLIGRVFIPRTAFWVGYGVLLFLLILTGVATSQGAPLVAAVAGGVFMLQLLAAGLFWGILGLVKLFRSWAALSRSVYEREKGGRR